MTHMYWPMFLPRKGKKHIVNGMTFSNSLEETMLTDEIDHVENKVERLLEMSFDHTAAMLNLLNKEAQELKVESELHTIYDAGRRTLKKNLQGLVLHLESLKFEKGSKLDLFQRKCQEFGI